MDTTNIAYGSPEYTALKAQADELENLGSRLYREQSNLHSKAKYARDAGQKQADRLARLAATAEQKWNEVNDRHREYARAVNDIALRYVALSHPDPDTRTLASCRLDIAKHFQINYGINYQPIDDLGREIDAMITQRLQGRDIQDYEMQRAKDVVLQTNWEYEASRIGTDKQRTADSTFAWAAAVATWDRQRKGLGDRLEALDLPKEVKDDARRKLHNDYKYASDSEGLIQFLDELEASIGPRKEAEAAAAKAAEEKKALIAQAGTDLILQTLTAHPRGLSVSKLSDIVRSGIYTDHGYGEVVDAGLKLSVQATRDKITLSKRAIRGQEVEWITLNAPIPLPKPKQTNDRTTTAA